MGKNMLSLFGRIHLQVTHRHVNVYSLEALQSFCTLCIARRVRKPRLQAQFIAYRNDVVLKMLLIGVTKEKVGVCSRASCPRYVVPYQNPQFSERKTNWTYYRTEGGHREPRLVHLKPVEQAIA